MDTNRREEFSPLLVFIRVHSRLFRWRWFAIEPPIDAKILNHEWTQMNAKNLALISVHSRLFAVISVAMGSLSNHESMLRFSTTNRHK
jgi:hypothetical protein